jgi:hypothetical protein
MRSLVIITGLVLMATGAPTSARAEENINILVTPSCVFGEDAGAIRPHLLNLRPALIKASHPPKVDRLVRRQRRNPSLRREGVWMAGAWP